MSWKALGAQERLAAAVRFGSELKATWGTRNEVGFREFVEALLAQGECEVVDALDQALGSSREDREKRYDLHGALAANIDANRVGSGQSVARILERNPDSLLLAPYRVGGIEFLVSVAGDLRAGVGDRVLSLRLLEVHANESVIPELMALMSDATEDAEWGPPIGPFPTIGEYAAQAIRAIRSRAGKR